MSKIPHPRTYATRFFARVQSFTAECPHCGAVAAVRAANQHGSTTPAIYDARTARWTCRDCGRTFVIGLLAWPCPRGDGAQAPPDDQIPGPRQLAQLRSDGGSYWMPEELRTIGRQDVTNLTGEEERQEPEDPLDLDLALHPPDMASTDWRSHTPADRAPRTFTPDRRKKKDTRPRS